MKSFRFSPIKNKKELFEAIIYLHFESFRLLKQNLGYILPVSGNVGIFCHYEDEFERLIEIRKGSATGDQTQNMSRGELHVLVPFFVLISLLLYSKD